MDQKTGLTPTSGQAQKLLKHAAATSMLRERQILDSFLLTGEFNRSPNLEKILVYLCEQYFQGTSSAVKEFSIATEALGRGPAFDPKKDSIVRVEMHRLRRRLREFRKGRGADAIGWIDFPEKSYSPQFHFAPLTPTVVALSTSPASEGEQLPAHTPPPPPPIKLGPAVPAKGSELRWLAGLLTVALLGLLWWSPWKRSASSGANPAATAESAPPSGAIPSSMPREEAFPIEGEIRIMAGRQGNRFVDRYGQIWSGDRFFTGGEAVTNSSEVRSRGLDPNLFASMREGDFRYDIPLPNKPHELTLFFAETLFGEGNPLGGGESSRPFFVSVNGKVVLDNFDVIADAHDANSMTARLFRDVRPAADGKLHLQFTSSAAAKAFVNAIQLRPGISGAIRPIRIVCRPQPYRDTKGNVWQADAYYQGGQQITRPNGAPVPVDADLYRGEHYGRFTYAIPVAPGSYTLKLYFWEYWWGKDRPGKGGPKSRIFDVFANFKPLLQNFDIIETAGRDQWTVKTFSGLKPNAEGKIALDFVPHVNYAMINAIEILDEGVKH